MTMSTRYLAFSMGLQKAAKTGIVLDDVLDHVMESARQVAGASVTPETKLDDIAHAERLVTDLELDFDVKLGDEDLTRMFALGSLQGLANDLSRHVMRAKTASSFSPPSNPAAKRHQNHQKYLARRSQVQMHSRMYRMAHMHQLRRKSRAYRKKVKRGIIRPKKRTGTAAGGYTLVPR